MHVDRIPNRTSPPAYLLRETYREGRKVRKRTLANITHWPLAKIEALRRLLRDQLLGGDRAAGLRLLRSLPHGHVAAALGMLRQLGLDHILSQGGRQPAREVALCIAMMVARVIDPMSKLATARLLDSATANCSAGAVLGLGAVDEQELYAALDWLLGQQERIEKALARRHLKSGTLVLYDVTSSYVEGRCCPLAKRGYNRDGKSGKLQIVFGLLCTPHGCPVAIEVFEGNVGDPTTLQSQIAKLKERFGLERVVLVGDRGMITQARIDEDPQPAGLDWITALRGAGDPRTGRGGRHATVAVRRARYRRDHLARLSGRAADGLPQSAARAGARAQARRVARGHRDESWVPSTPASAAPSAAAARHGRDRPRGRRRDRQAQDGQALRPDHHGRRCHASRARPRRSPPRPRLDGIYVLRTSLKPRPSTPLNRQRLQIPRSGGARLSMPQDRRSGGPPDLSWPFASACAPTCSSACSPITSSGTCAGRSARSCSRTTTRLPPRPRARSIVAKAERSAAARQSRHTAHRRRAARPQLPQPARDLATLTRNTMAWSANRGNLHARPNPRRSRPAPSSFLTSPSNCSQ